MGCPTQSRSSSRATSTLSGTRFWSSQAAPDSDTLPARSPLRARPSSAWAACSVGVSGVKNGLGIGLVSRTLVDTHTTLDTTLTTLNVIRIYNTYLSNTYL